MILRSLAAVAIVALSMPLSTLPAAADAAFSQSALATAQKAGAPVLVDVYASWCPTCRAQASVIKKLSNDARFKDLVHLRVDFDNQKDDVRKLGANKQSTLIVYKGTQEVGRVVGVTDAGQIEALLAKAL